MDAAGFPAAERSEAAESQQPTTDRPTPGRKLIAESKPDRRRHGVLCGPNPNSRKSVSAKSRGSSRLRGRDSMSAASSPVYVGIDVSKARLDVHVLPQDIAFSVENSPAGSMQLLQKLQPMQVAMVVLEATGRYQ